GTISNAELAERLPGKFLGVLGALGVSDRLCVLFSDPSAAPGAGSGGRRGRFQTPSSLRSPSSLLEFLGAPWLPRRFRSSLPPLFGPVRGTGRGDRRSPRTLANAQLAEIAEQLARISRCPLAPSAFQIVAASSFRTRSRHRAQGAEVAGDDFKRRAR